MSHQLALQEIKKFTKAFKAFEEAENAIVALASLDQNVKELEEARKFVNETLDKEKKELEVFRSSMKEEKKKVQLSFEKQKGDLGLDFSKRAEALEGVFNELKIKLDTETADLESKRTLALSNLFNLSEKIKATQVELLSLEDKVKGVRKQIADMFKS